MPVSDLWAKRLAAALGCLALLAGCIASALLLIPRSWHDLDDANVRMHIFRFHVYDPDFIWSAVAFGAIVLTVVSMFACWLWVFWMLVSRWNLPGAKDESQR
jgi:hypothetical protein